MCASDAALQFDYKFFVCNTVIASMPKAKTDRLLRAAMGLLMVALVYFIYSAIHERIVVAGDDAPEFSVTADSGQKVSLPNFGGKVLVLNFWATWCPPCELEIPWLVELQRNHPNDLVVLGVSIDDTPDKLKPYAAGKQMNYPVLVGRDREDVQDAFGPLFGIPVSVFIDRDGKITRRHSGIATKAQFEKEIQGLL